MNRERKRESAQSRTLARAAEVLGGVAALASHLGVPEPALREWLDSGGEIPDAVFIAALEIVLIHLEGRASRH